MVFSIQFCLLDLGLLETTKLNHNPSPMLCVVVLCCLSELEHKNCLQFSFSCLCFAFETGFPYVALGALTSQSSTCLCLRVLAVKAQCRPGLLFLLKPRVAFPEDTYWVLGLPISKAGSISLVMNSLSFDLLKDTFVCLYFLFFFFFFLSSFWVCHCTVFLPAGFLLRNFFMIFREIPCNNLPFFQFSLWRLDYIS